MKLDGDPVKPLKFCLLALTFSTRDFGTSRLRDL